MTEPSGPTPERAPLIVGLGQASAGDDGAGLRVIDELARRGHASSRLLRGRDASCLVELLAKGERLIVVDAALVEPARLGQVLELGPADLADAAYASLSSHGVSVAGALQLARTLYPESPASVRLVAIGIQRPTRFDACLSPPIADAVGRAADLIERLCRAEEDADA